MSKENQSPVEQARERRQRMPDPERYLWSLLRDRRLAGLKFRRQFPVGPFVVDFYCESAKLAVELDGTSHDGRGTYDKNRQHYLEESGLTVYRIHNEELLQDAEVVLYGIAQAAGIDLRTHYGNLFGPTPSPPERSQTPPPHVPPLLWGEGPGVRGASGREEQLRERRTALIQRMQFTEAATRHPLTPNPSPQRRGGPARLEPRLPHDAAYNTEEPEPRTQPASDRSLTHPHAVLPSPLGRGAGGEGSRLTSERRDAAARAIRIYLK